MSGLQAAPFYSFIYLELLNKMVRCTGLPAYKCQSGTSTACSPAKTAPEKLEFSFCHLSLQKKPSRLLTVHRIGEKPHWTLSVSCIQFQLIFCHFSLPVADQPHKPTGYFSYAALNNFFLLQSLKSYPSFQATEKVLQVDLIILFSTPIVFAYNISIIYDTFILQLALLLTPSL